MNDNALEFARKDLTVPLVEQLGWEYDFTASDEWGVYDQYKKDKFCIVIYGHGIYFDDGGLTCISEKHLLNGVIKMRPGAHIARSHELPYVDYRQQVRAGEIKPGKSRTSRSKSKFLGKPVLNDDTDFYFIACVTKTRNGVDHHVVHLAFDDEQGHERTICRPNYSASQDTGIGWPQLPFGDFAPDMKKVVDELTETSPFMKAESCPRCLSTEVHEVTSYVIRQKSKVHNA